MCAQEGEKLTYLSIMREVGLRRHALCHFLEAFRVALGNKRPRVFQPGYAVVVEPRQYYHQGVVVK